MDEDSRQRIQAIEKSMRDWAHSTLRIYEARAALSNLIRGAVEFKAYLERGSMGRGEELEKIRPRPMHFSGRPVDLDASMLNDINESNIAAYLSFCTVMMGLNIKAPLASTIQWDTITAMSIRELYLVTYQRLEETPDPARKCRLLLDLYKIRLVFAGITEEGYAPWRTSPGGPWTTP
jgi:hypothetical protein